MSKFTISQKIWLSIHLVSLALYIIWFSILLVWENDWEDHDNSRIDSWFDNNSIKFMGIIFSIVCLGIAYLISILIYYGYIFRKNSSEDTYKVDFHIIHKVLTVFSLVLCIGMLIAYSIQWPDEFPLMQRSLQASLPIMQLIILLLLAPFTYVVFKMVQKQKVTTHRVLLSIFFILIYAFFYSIPIWYHSAHIISDGIPPKPFISAHRGISEDAPENTIPAFEKALELNVGIVESDVIISYDGIPFMMHDNSLKRTTNVQQVFPNLYKMRANTFYISQIKQLDAGSWKGPSFVGTAVPLLSEVIDLMKFRNSTSFLMFDVQKISNENHPFYGKEDEVVLNLIDQKNFSDRMIWLCYDRNTDDLYSRFPHINLASKIATINDIQNGIFNLRNGNSRIDTNEEISSFAVNRSYIAYTVNTPWLFDQMWFLGAKYVTTNKAAFFASENYVPTWYLYSNVYYGLVIGFSIFSAGFSFAIIILLLKKEDIQSEVALLATQTNNTNCNYKNDTTTEIGTSFS